MKTQISPTTPIHDPGTFAGRSAAPGAASSPSPSPAAPQHNADLRLIIEEDEASGMIVYKTLDRRTGEIVRQLPREEVVRLKDAPSYAPGDVADSRS